MLDVLVLQCKSAMQTLKAPMNTEKGLILRVTPLLMCVSLVLGLQDQKVVPSSHKCSA